MTYLEFLRQIYSILTAAGDKVPDVLAALQRLLNDLQDPAFKAAIAKIEADVQDLAQLLIGTGFIAPQAAIGHGAAKGTLEATLEAQIAEIIKKHGGHGAPKGPFLDFLKQLADAFVNNPALMQLILSILLKK